MLSSFQRVYLPVFVLVRYPILLFQPHRPFFRTEAIFSFTASPWDDALSIASLCGSLPIWKRTESGDTLFSKHTFPGALQLLACWLLASKQFVCLAYLSAFQRTCRARC